MQKCSICIKRCLILLTTRPICSMCTQSNVYDIHTTQLTNRRTRTCTNNVSYLKNQQQTHDKECTIYYVYEKEQQPSVRVDSKTTH